MAEDRKNRQIVANIVGLGDGLGMSTIAEGIECEEQLEMLRSMSCGEGQGYLISKPLPAKDFLTFWTEHTTKRIVNMKR